MTKSEEKRNSLMCQRMESRSHEEVLAFGGRGGYTHERKRSRVCSPDR